MSPALLAAARARHSAVFAEQHAGSITIGSTTYQGGALHLGPLKQEFSESGNWKPAQRMSIHIPKSRLATAPAKRTTFTCRGLTFAVDEVAGQSPDAIEWIIRGIRWPASPA